MKVTWEVNEASGLVRVVAEFGMTEIASLQLDRVDRALLSEPHEEPADILLKAEMIARRIAQRRATLETRAAMCEHCGALQPPGGSFHKRDCPTQEIA